MRESGAGKKKRKEMIGIRMKRNVGGLRMKKELTEIIGIRCCCWSKKEKRVYRNNWHKMLLLIRNYQIAIISNMHVNIKLNSLRKWNCHAIGNTHNL